MRTFVRIIMSFFIAFLLLCPITAANSDISEILAAHQSFRAEVGSPALVYSDSLASGAQDWANYLAANSLFEHSGSDYGENLFIGTSGYYSWTNAVNFWGSEKKYFIYGPFGDGSSSTGHWYDIGHYTQVIWYNTQQCGCGKATGYYPSYSSNMDVFVCRYNPRGNYLGQYPFPVPTTIPTTVPTTIPTTVTTTSPTTVPTTIPTTITTTSPTTVPTTIPTTVTTTNPTTVPTTIPLNSPNAYFSESIPSGSNPLTVQFTDKSTNSPVLWSWYFGDGTTISTKQNPTHHFTNSGSYKVILMVSNNIGTNFTSQMISVNMSTWVGPLQPLPRSMVQSPAPLIPKDLNGDGLYEDVNGDGIVNIFDIIDFATNLYWITDSGLNDNVNEYQPFFDFDGNGVVNFYDVIALYNNIPKLGFVEMLK